LTESSISRTPSSAVPFIHSFIDDTIDELCEGEEIDKEGETGAGNK
jgi:hypothetical protein